MSSLNSLVQQNVEDYLSKNAVRAQAGRKCVDGRYLPHQATGMLARPGGDCGYVMALLAVNKKKNLGMTPEQCFDAVYKAVSQNDGSFCMHTDHHADPDEHTRHGLIGCGHLAKAANADLCKAYAVESEDMKRMIEHARDAAKTASSLEMVNLTGEHAEKGILIVHSDEYTVNAYDSEIGEMYFVYDEDRDIAFMKQLVGELGIDGVSYEDLKQASDTQIQATLHNLAMGLPIYSVMFDDSTPHVSYVDTVH